MTFCSKIFRLLHCATAMLSVTSCYADETQATNFVDATYSSGLAGLGCGRHDAQFDNFTLHRLHRDDEK